MFAKAPPKKEKPIEEKNEVKTETPSQSNPDDSPGKENKASQETSNKTSETKLSKHVTNKTSSTKRRKRIQVMSDSDSSDNEEEEEPEPMDNYHEQVKLFDLGFM